MIAVEGTKFISEVEFDQVVEEFLSKSVDHLTEIDPVMGLNMSLLLSIQLGVIRKQLFGEKGDE